MATPFDGISQRLDFASGGEDSSSDNSSDDYAFRIPSTRVVSPRVLNPESACRTPRVQRHHSRSSTVSPPIQCSNPIPYGTWRKLRLSDSPSTPKVRQQSLQMKQTVLSTFKPQWWVSFVAFLHPCRACCPGPPGPTQALRSAALRGPYALSPLLPVSSVILCLSTWIRLLLKRSTGAASCWEETTSWEMMKTVGEGTSSCVVSICLPNEGLIILILQCY